MFATLGTWAKCINFHGVACCEVIIEQTHWIYPNRNEVIHTQFTPTTCSSGGTNSVVLLFSVHVCTHVWIHRQNNSDIPTLKKILEVDLGGHAAGPKKLTPLFILYLDTAITMQFYFTIYETKNNSWLMFITINQLSYEIEYLPLGYFQPRHKFLVIRVLTLPIFGKYTCIIISHQIGSDFVDTL